MKNMDMGGSFATGIRVPLYSEFLLDLNSVDILEWGTCTVGSSPLYEGRPVPATHVEVVGFGGGYSVVVWARQEWYAHSAYVNYGAMEPARLELVGALRDLTTPVFFRSSVFAKGDIGTAPSHVNGYMVATVYFSATTFGLPDRVFVQNVTGDVIASGTAAANALASNWDAGRGSSVTRTKQPLNVLFVNARVWPR